MTDIAHAVPPSFIKTLADFGIDVRGKNVLEVGAGGSEQPAWLAKLGAERVIAVDPLYYGDNEEAARRKFFVGIGYPPNVLQRVRFFPQSVEDHMRSGIQYPVVMAFQVYPRNWESYMQAMARVTDDDGVALIMMDKFALDEMPKGIFEKYFRDVKLHHCGGGDNNRDLASQDLFFIQNLNRYAFVCRGPKRHVKVAMDPAERGFP